jgi:hypothetical protein
MQHGATMKITYVSDVMANSTLRVQQPCSKHLYLYCKTNTRKYLNFVAKMTTRLLTDSDLALEKKKFSCRTRNIRVIYFLSFTWRSTCDETGQASFRCTDYKYKLEQISCSVPRRPAHQPPFAEKSVFVPNDVFTKLQILQDRPEEFFWLWLNGNK